MASWADLGISGQLQIQQELYKSLFGVPSAIGTKNLSQEIVGNSRLSIFQEQIYRNSIPPIAPQVTSDTSPTLYNLLDNTDIWQKTVPDLSYAFGDGVYKYVYKSNTNLVYYPNILLSNQGIDQNSYIVNAMNNVQSSTDIVVVNVLKDSIPILYDPQNTYCPFITLQSPGTLIQKIPFGSDTLPWLLNSSSGILLIFNDF